ncbi:MAG TPA: exopolyphosphatase [Flavobacteriaceae bacterium]|nr:exopolyphosphatase [Flavobacteriaceae bacterium]
MLTIEKYGAIDIGSNAVRLLIVSVIEQVGKKPIFKKVSLVRVPIRLGADVFSEGKISPINIERMTDTMTAFRLLLKTHNITRFRACATSAMREAENGQDIIRHIRNQSELSVDIIDGQDEADIIASTDLKELIDEDRTFLYVDVGGGSTELTLFESGHRIASKSLDLGTVRLINSPVEPELWEEMKNWIKKETAPFKKISLIGSGGNINTIYKRSAKKPGKPLSYIYLSSYYKFIKELSYEDRITELGMNPDRADVVVPATKIYLSAMKWSGAKSIYVPKIGLSDGIIRSLYQQKLKEENPSYG